MQNNIDIAASSACGPLFHLNKTCTRNDQSYMKFSDAHHFESFAVKRNSR